MPWKVRQRGEEHCVYKQNPDGTESVVHCHPTRDKAIAHQRALYVHAEKEAVFFGSEFRRGRPLLSFSAIAMLAAKGGAGSGNFGHSGRPGLVGGSESEGGGGAGSTTAAGDPAQVRWSQPVDPKTGRPIPIKVDSIEEAAQLVLQGKVVELPTVAGAATLVSRLAEMANEAKAAGREAHNYDLCNVSVKGTNLFCAEHLRSTKYPEGVPRIDMPQLGGDPVPGSAADKLPHEKDGSVDAGPAFRDYLVNELKIKVTDESHPAYKLKASQRELVGPKVGGMMTSKTYDPAARAIFVSNDDYVVDGHHRWAAVVGRDAANNKLGDINMNIVRIDAPISEVLQIANHWSKEFGIRQKGVKSLIGLEIKGGTGSGNFGHAGRPGLVGGSEAEGGGAASSADGGSAGAGDTKPFATGGAGLVAGDREKFVTLKAQWAKLNNDLLNEIDTPNNAGTTAKLNQQKQLVKDMYKLNADPGGIEGIKLPGGPRDVVIIGAGPGGMSAAIMGGADGLDTLLIDANTVAGGQARMSSRIENFPGFPLGVRGEKLMGNMFEQAERMGAEAKLGVRVTKLEHDEATGLKTLTLSTGEKVTARAVIISGGVEFQKMNFPGADAPNCIYADSKKLADLAQNKSVVVVGGSNGASQAALAAAETASYVTILSRSPISKGMSDYQVQALRNHPKIKIIEGDEVEKFSGNKVHTKGGQQIDADALGIFIGGGSNTKWLPSSIRIKGTKIDVNSNLETTMPGVFAAGDIHAKSIGRIGAAVGDGQLAARNIHDYFARVKG
jgi:thioredoxin reductase